MVEKKSRDSFSKIEKDLQREFEREYQQYLVSKSYLWYGLIVLVVLLGAFWFRENDRKESVRWGVDDVTTVSSTSDDIGIRDGFTRELVANEQEFDFKWDLSAIQSLKVGSPYEDNGTSLQDILESYGKPSEAYFYGEDKLLHLFYSYADYENYQDVGNIFLLFYEKDSKYYLMSKSAYDLYDKAYPTSGEISRAIPLIKEDFSMLMVGDSNTGEGGATYADVIARFGLPNDSRVSVSHRFGIESQELSLSYQDLSGNRMTLYLKQEQEKEGLFRLYKKDGVFSE